MSSGLENGLAIDGRTGRCYWRWKTPRDVDNYTHPESAQYTRGLMTAVMRTEL